MRTTTAAFDTAKDKTGSTPVWLLQLDSGGSTYYYSDRAVTVDAQDYDARVLSWGQITGINDRMSGGGVINSTNVSLTELPTSISSKVAIGNVCRIYLWFDGESLTDTLLLFKGTITDPIDVTEQTLTFKVDGYEESRNQVVGEIITATEFSGASTYALGKVKPIIYGQVYDHECLPVDAGSITTLTAEITDASTADIAVTDTTSFPSSGNIWIEAEKVAYTGKTSTTFTGITRAQSSTIATAHSRGAHAVEDQTNYDYLIAGHSCQTPTAVYINGVALSSGWSKVASGGNDLLRITDGDALRDALRVAVSDDLGATTTLGNSDTVAIEASSPSTLSSTQILSYPSPTYVQYSVGLTTATFSTLSDCSYSEVTVSVEVFNVAGWRIHVWINGNNSGGAHTVHTYDDCYTANTTPTCIVNKDRTITVAENADITKIGIDYCYDIGGGVSSAKVGYTCMGTLNRIATVPIDPSTTKDSYAYSVGTFATETLHGAKITTDTIGYNYSRPDEIVEHLLLNYGNNIVAGDLDTSVTSNTSYSTNYPMGFALSKQYDLGVLCRQIAYQCASRFFWDSGKAYLIKIPEGTPTADKSLVADDIGYQSMRMHWTPNADIINYIDASYDLRGREYLAVDSDSDSASITSYGTRDGSHKMKLDLINSSTAAGNVVDDFILKFKEPKRVAEFSTPLQNAELQRGDIVAVTHPIDGGWTSKLFEILSTSVTIGNTKTPDSIRFTAEEI